MKMRMREEFLFKDVYSSCQPKLDSAFFDAKNGGIKSGKVDFDKNIMSQTVCWFLERCFKERKYAAYLVDA